MANNNGPRQPQQAGNLYEHVGNYAFDQWGNKILRYREPDDRLPLAVRKAKALVELELIFLMQENIGLDPKLDDKQKKEGYAKLAKRYGALSRYITPKDIAKVKALKKE